jgi:FtsH-binding integral membrane protein
MSFQNVLAVLVFTAATIFYFYIGSFWWAILSGVIVLINVVQIDIKKKYPELANIFLAVITALISFILAWLSVDETILIVRVIFAITGMIFLIFSFLGLMKAQKKYLS